MTSLNRLRVGWSGFIGAPGVSTFYFLDVATAVESVQTLFSAMVDMFPTDVHFQVEASGDIIEDTTGVITGAWGGTPQSALGGTSTAVYSAPAGAMIGWETSTIVDGRRIRGKTFLVPVASNQYQTDGSLSAAALGIVGDAALEFVIEQSASLVIWHRPRAARAADGSRPAVTARAGGHGLVTGSRVPDKSVVLRTRRD